MEEWHALRDQPCYGSQVGGNIGSGSSGSKRSHDGDACGSNSVGSSARPIGREAAKRKVKRKARTLPWRRWKRSGLNSNNSRSKSLNN
ncbi:hypothetical protein MtrunA17_Chr1g0170191 [Medicago truncatula]|nr:hypothetical protein MtrunA17_Chr1g0170191 [Medicago truncatula]